MNVFEALPCFYYTFRGVQWLLCLSLLGEISWSSRCIQTFNNEMDEDVAHGDELFFTHNETKARSQNSHSRHVSTSRVCGCRPLCCRTSGFVVAGSGPVGASGLQEGERAFRPGAAGLMGSLPPGVGLGPAAPAGWRAPLPGRSAEVRGGGGGGLHGPPGPLHALALASHGLHVGVRECSKLRGATP